MEGNELKNADKIFFQELLTVDEDILKGVDVDVIIGAEAFNKEMTILTQEEAYRKLSNIANAFRNSPKGHLNQIEINKAAMTYVKLDSDSDEEDNGITAISSSSETESDNDSGSMDVDKFLALFKE